MKRLLMLAAAMLLAFGGAAHAGDYGVYVKVIEKAQGSFEDTVKATEEALEAAGWQVLASYEAGVMERCGKRAHNIVVHSPDYAGRIMEQGPDSAFALPLRVGVYEDREGVSVAFVNPASINRTVLGDGVAEELSVQTMNALSGAVASGVRGEVVNSQIGKIRAKGRVGGMGGGKFKNKIKVIHRGGDFEAVVEGVRNSIESDDQGWRLVYSLRTPGDEAVIFGLTRPQTEAKAFDIAGQKREKKSKKQWVCPGIDHAAAFPVEVVVYKKDGGVRVVTLKEMYRMKLYFEDAGNLAFMKNMAMPGRIEKQVIRASTNGLEN